MEDTDVVKDDDFLDDDPGGRMPGPPPVPGRGGPPPAPSQTGPPPRRRRPRLKPHRGGTILTFGILGLLCCIIFAIMAWVMGNADMQEIRAGRMDPSGEGSTNAGRIMGMIGCILAIVGFILGLINLAIAGSMMPR